MNDNDMPLTVKDIFLFVSIAVVSVAFIVLIIWVAAQPYDVCNRRVQNLTVQQIVDCTAKLEKETE